MNLFYSLPEDIQGHIQCLLTKSKYNKVVKVIPGNVRDKKQLWKSKHMHAHVIAELNSLSTFIRAYSKVTYVEESYLVHIIEHMDQLDLVLSLYYFRAFSRDYFDVNDDILNHEYSLYLEDMHEKVVQQFYILQENAFVGGAF